MLDVAPSAWPTVALLVAVFEQLLRGVAKSLLRLGVREDDPSVGINAEDRIRCRFEHSPEENIDPLAMDVR